jgi:hypothetical protein
MAYHVARILHRYYHFDVRVITASPGLAELDRHGRFRYDPVFPCVPLAGCEQLIRADDVLICNPSFSSLNLGLKVRGRKIMYAQGFTTFSLLDCFFDHYVAVSGFVRGVLAQTYGIDAPVIPAFVPDSPRLFQEVGEWDPVPAWEARPPYSMALNFKGNLDDQMLLLDSVRRELRFKDRELEASIEWDRAVAEATSGAPREKLLERISSARYLLTLSLAEGFGLVPLEAMAMGSVVVGFDGYGGREYMTPGCNCAVAASPDVAGVADGIIRVMRDLSYAQRLVAGGVLTARRYNYEAFRQSWVQELGRLLAN